MLLMCYADLKGRPNSLTVKSLLLVKVIMDVSLLLSRESNLRLYDIEITRMTSKPAFSGRQVQECFALLHLEPKLFQLEVVLLDPDLILDEINHV